MNPFSDLQQDYSRYTAEHHKVWQILFERQRELLEDKASRAFLQGIDKVHFRADQIPDFRETAARLQHFTGWTIQAVPGIVDDDVFFELLSKKQFPSTTWIRTMKELDYLEEPDMFHDVFGHMPLLVEPDYCEFLQGLSQLACKHLKDAYAIELLSRIYWYTIEFGLIQEEGKLCIYGSGILSSMGETPYSLSDQVPKHAFDVAQIMASSYIKSEFQKQYFIIESYEQLYNSLDEVEQVLEKMLRGKELVS